MTESLSSLVASFGGGGRRVVFVSGDDVDAKTAAMSLFEGAGFAAIGAALAGLDLVRL